MTKQLAFVFAPVVYGAYYSAVLYPIAMAHLRRSEIKMKKIWAFVCAITMVFTLTACGDRTASSQNAVSSKASQPASSVGESTSVSSGAASGKASSTAPKAASAVEAVGKNGENYQIKNASYKYKQDNMVYSASYPQLVGNVANLDKINESMKSCALKTINSLGTGKKSVKTTVKVNGDVTYHGKDFISVGFNEYTALSPKVKAERVLRTMNINLKTGASVAASDLIVKNDSLYKALEKAAKEQKSADVAANLTANAIKSGIDPNVIYFTDDGVGFSVQISNPKKHLVTLDLTFAQAKPYRTKNDIWKNFK